MQKLILMSIMIMTFSLPIWYSRTSDPQRTLPKMQRAFAVFCGIYVFAVVYLGHRL